MLKLPESLCLLAAVVVVAQAYGYNPYQGSYESSYLARCAHPRRPCRLDLQFESAAGVLISNPAAQLCSCNYPTTCPTNWNLTDHVISRNLISSTYRTTLRLMFCDAVQPQKTCVDGETSVILSGYLEIPNELELYHCTCRDGVPLQLSRRWRTDSFKYMHEYVCDNQMPTCSMSVQPCVKVEGAENSYHCKCPGRFQCHMPHATWGLLANTPLFGYCGPMGSLNGH